MAQSLAKLYVHLIFSTKHRQRVLPPEERGDMHAYMAGILQNQESPAIEINSQPDHAHVLFILGRTVTLSSVAGQLKQSSTVWLRQQHADLKSFHWQNGYGAFSVSQSNVHEVRAYIRDQEQHHRTKSFQEEFLTFLQRHDLAFDEQYVWD